MCGIMLDTRPDREASEFRSQFEKIAHRGPDDLRIKRLPSGGFVGFHRLAIVDLSAAGSSPFVDEHSGNVLICNGEIYNHQHLRANHPKYPYSSHSDCEVILACYAQSGIEQTAQHLDGEFAFIIYDARSGKYLAARDPLGIRPLFYGYDLETGHLLMASEAKCLVSLCRDVAPFPPGHYFDGERLLPYLELDKIPCHKNMAIEDVFQGIRNKLIEAVSKRLEADVPIGYLLSGGLDSSLVCAIASQQLGKRLTTFAVGLNENPIDIHFARIVAQHLGTDHHEVTFSMDEVLDNLDKIVYALETWDVTTIRAAIGMYFVCKYVRQNTNIKVLLTGEVSDEIFGYKYTDFAPSPEAFQAESQKRIRELYMYDVLRADRCIAAHSLEARVPFSDKDFVQFTMSIPPELKMNTSGHGKYLLRKAFDNNEFLPTEILYREKAAFSDAVGHGLVEQLRAYAERKYSDEYFVHEVSRLRHAPPLSKEALLYREIFESHFPGCAAWVSDFWLPNQSWPNCQVTDPSARVLPNYGKSGSTTL